MAEDIVFRDEIEDEPTTLELAIEYYKDDPEGLLDWAREDSEDEDEDEGEDDRAANFNYELRHPGHGDQSVHNPHKGGGAYAPGGWRPVSKAELEAMDFKVFKDMQKDRPSYNPNTAFAKYRSERSQGETFVNGSVVVRFPARNKLTPAQQKAVLKDIDEGSKFVPEGMMSNPNFPIEISVGKISSDNRYGEWIGDGVGGGRINLSMDLVKTDDLVINRTSAPINKFGRLSVFPKSVGWHPDATVGMPQRKFTISHELGHATQSWNGRNLNPAKFIGIGFISEYARKNSKERYAEHFAAWVAGATDSMTTTLASEQGWRKP